MSRLKEISKYKQNILMKLISSDKIVKAVANEPENFLEHPVDDPYALIYDQIYPYNRIPNVEEERKTFITIKHGGYKLINNSFKSGYITFFVYTHTKLMKTDYGETRSDYIISEIDELFNKSRDFGIGELKFDGMDEMPGNDKYFGQWIRYKVADWN